MSWDGSDVNASDENSSKQENTSGNNSGTTSGSNTGSTEGNTTDTAKTYTITYILNYSNATMEATTQTVTYGEAFTLLTPTVPTGDDYRFVKWLITGTTTEFKSGTYTEEGDISLTAVWEDSYTKNY